MDDPLYMFVDKCGLISNFCLLEHQLCETLRIVCIRC